MPRRKNVVYKTILDVGSPAKLAAIIRRNERIIRDLNQQLVRDTLLQTQRNVQVRVLQPMLAQLRLYPARQLGMRIRWTSPKQKRYVLMLLRKMAEERLGRPLKPGDSIAYVRTGGYGRGWRSEAQVNLRKGTLRLRTENVALNERGEPMARYVSGDIGLGESRQSLARYEKPKQRFHTDRGWRTAAPAIIQPYYKKAEEEAGERYFGTFDRIVGRHHR